MAGWGYNPNGVHDVPGSLTGETVTAIAAGQYHSVAIVAPGTP
ncbi:hypothetical protein [Catellatospora sp. TT07R-123]|nr:hypothetical protein [Catellatospora sp. TT07R-123]